MTDQPIPLGLCQCGCGEPTSIAKHNDSRNGYVKGEPRRYLKGHRGRTNKGVMLVDSEPAMREVLRLVRAGSTDRAACHAAGYTHWMIWIWKEKYPEFRRQLIRAREAAREMRVDARFNQLVRLCARGQSIYQAQTALKISNYWLRRYVHEVPERQRLLNTACLPHQTEGHAQRWDALLVGLELGLCVTEAAKRAHVSPGAAMAALRDETHIRHGELVAALELGRELRSPWAWVPERRAA